MKQFSWFWSYQTNIYQTKHSESISQLSFSLNPWLTLGVAQLTGNTNWSERIFVEDE